MKSIGVKDEAERAEIETNAGYHSAVEAIQEIKDNALNQKVPPSARLSAVVHISDIYLNRPMETLAVIGRRWFDRVYGNTYCTAEILINGRYWGKTNCETGYGDYYIQAVGDMLAKKDLLPGIKTYPNTGGQEALWRYCSRKGIYFYYTVTDVSRKSDL